MLRVLSELVAGKVLFTMHLLLHTSKLLIAKRFKKASLPIFIPLSFRFSDHAIKFSSTDPKVITANFIYKKDDIRIIC